MENKNYPENNGNDSNNGSTSMESSIKLGQKGFEEISLVDDTPRSPIDTPATIKRKPTATTTPTPMVIPNKIYNATSAGSPAQSTSQGNTWSPNTSINSIPGQMKAGIQQIPLKDTDPARRRSSGMLRHRVASSDSLPRLDVDLEQGNPYGYMETLQDQSTRLTNIMAAKTELASFDQTTPDPPKEIVAEKETSGIRYWVQEISSAKEHGGDYKRRLQTALRTALGSLTTFSVLVFPQQDILGAVWIGNIFMHCNIQSSFGASLTSVIGFARSVIITTTVSWPVAYFMSHLDLTASCILLPFCVFILSFLIMSCPQLTFRNLMILVMYLVVASPIREDILWWHPLGWVVTYLIALVVALVMNAFPLPNFALTSSHACLKRLEKDLTMLLLACKTYSDNTGTNLKLARTAVASIEFMHTRICETVGELKKKLPATTVELKWMCKSQSAADLAEWVGHSDKLLKPLKMLRNALMQRVLGEEYNAYSPALREAKMIINEEMRESRDRMVSALIAAIAVCHAWADPSEHRTVLPDVQGELRVALRECRQTFQDAMVKASERLGDNMQTDVPIFAHLTRRMASYSALFALGDSLLDYLENHSWEAQEIKNDDIPRGCCDVSVQWWRAVFVFWEKSWLWYNPDHFRLALKTAVGMVFASLFVVVPYLWKISAPFGVWPGLTIASVNLGTTGSSFHKASDRLFGTLLAAAYAMLVSDLFPGTKDHTKIPAIAVFTFVVTYLRNAEHAYKYTYAATSIGSMLYGSIKNDFNVPGYIPKRIELIFVGVLIFTVVELMLFPRSSRKMVEGLGFQFFMAMKEFLKQAAKCSKRMEEYVVESHKATEYTKLMFDENDDPFQLKLLAECHKKLKVQSDKLKKEIDSAIEEPNVGFSLSLHSESFRGLVFHQGSCEMQASLLVNVMNRLAGYYQQDGHPIRESNWPHTHTQFLNLAHSTTEEICRWLQSVFSDGRLRAQEGNSVKAVSAVASFRALEDVRLQIVHDWSTCFADFVATQGFEGSDPIALMSLGITTTFILELCRHMQKAGKNLEEIAYRFPAFR